MSAIGQALNNWLQRQGASVMRQEATVCEALPPNTQEQMIAISIDSAYKIREMGAAMTHDYTLGRVFTGTRDKVFLPRPEGTIGTYHTHPFGAPFPSITDTLEVMNRDDKITCIGATGKPGTKIQCFTPNKPKWDDFQFKLRLLVDDIKDYNGKLSRKYNKSGTGLRKLLEGVGSPRYLGRIEYVTPEELENEAIIAEKSANVADEAIKVIIVEADRAAEAVKVAHIELGKVITEEEIKEAKLNVRAKEEEARRATARIIIEQELAIDARAAADEATFKAKVLALGKAEAIAANRDANEHLREGANLARRRDVLEGEIRAQLRGLAAPKEWKAHKWTNGFSEVPFFEAYPNMLDKCRVIWEELEEKLPYEL
ncbi:hypothetical protein ES703_15530 [subsurface metagenome]